MHTTYPNPFVAFCADAGFDSANHARCNEGWRYVSAFSIHDPATAITWPACAELLQRFFVHSYTILPCCSMDVYSNVVHSKWGVWWTLGEKLFGRRVIYSPWIIANLRGDLHSTWFDIIRWIVPCMALLYARLIWPHLGRLQVLCWSWRVPGALQLGWSQNLKCRRNGTESGYDIHIYILYIDILDLDFDCIVL